MIAIPLSGGAHWLPPGPLQLTSSGAGRSAFGCRRHRCASKCDFLSDEDKELLDAGRQLRNFSAHPDTAPALPLVAVVGMLATSFRLVAVLVPDGDESQRDMVGG